MAAATREDITQMFRDSWSLYHKVVALNHLNHREVISSFRDELQNLSGEIKLLDIGTGDGWLPAQILALENMPKVVHFTGVDSTAEALAIAKGTGDIPASTLDLIQSDMTEYMTSPQCESDTYDVVMSSYTLHHADTAGKRALVREIHRCLKPGGIFLWADVVNCVPGTNRGEVMVRWKERFKAYHGLTEDEKNEIWVHASTFDKPEEIAVMEEMLRDAGFETQKICHCDEVYTAVLMAKKKTD